MEKIRDFFRARKNKSFSGMNKKGAELQINTLITIILAILVLVILVFIFSSSARHFASTIFMKLKVAMGLINASQVSP